MANNERFQKRRNRIIDILLESNIFLPEPPIKPVLAKGVSRIIRKASFDLYKDEKKNYKAIQETIDKLTKSSLKSG